MTADSFWARFRRCSLFAAAWMVLAFLIGPMLVVVPVSLTDRPYLSLPEHAISLQHYRAFFSSEMWLSATALSFVIAVGATLASVVFGTLCAIACWRLSNRLSAAVTLLMLMPLIVPTVVQGLAMYRLWAAAGLFDSVWGVVLAHTLSGIPYVVITVSASLASFDVRLEQAARSLGASLAHTVRLVLLPNLMPGLLSGALFSFVHSFDELVIVLFITSRKVQTLPKRIWDGIQDQIDPTIAAVAVILMGLTIAALGIQLILRAAQSRRRFFAHTQPEPADHIPPAAAA